MVLGKLHILKLPRINHPRFNLFLILGAPVMDPVGTVILDQFCVVTNCVLLPWEAQFVTVTGIAPTLENQATPNKLLKSGYGILAY
jgi:hypothetical protein